jgi:transcriptional regulator with XRE-family HTH domain
MTCSAIPWNPVVGVIVPQFERNRRNFCGVAQFVVMANEWKLWGPRFRVHMRENRLSTRGLAERLRMSESALRSWLNGNREVNVTDFFRLCDVAKADPRRILFGQVGLAAAQKQALGRRVVQMLEADTAALPSYPQLVQPLQRDLGRKRRRR